MSEILVEFYWDCGRSGELTGLFVTTKEKLESLYGKEAYFGEALGKHSEISGTLSEDDFTIRTDNQEFIKLFDELVGDQGFNPFNYVQEEEPEEYTTDEELEFFHPNDE
jgi:hypothetical protein